MQLEGSLAILGDGDAGKPPGLVERRAAQEGGGAAEERAVPLVEPALGHRVEHLVLRRHPVERLQIPLDRVGIEEGVRGLDEEQLRILGEVADGLAQEGAERHVVGVEHDDDLAGGEGEPVVQVARLGVLVAGAGEVAAAERLGERGQFAPPLAGGLGLFRVRIGAFLVRPAVVEQPDGELVGRVVHLARGRQRHRQDGGVLVVARHEHVDGGQFGRARRRRRPPLERVGVDDQADEQDEDAVELAEQQQQAEAEADRIAGGGQRIGDPPQDVAEHHEAPERQKHEAGARSVEEQP